VKLALSGIGGNSRGFSYNPPISVFLSDLVLPHRVEGCVLAPHFCEPQDPPGVSEQKDGRRLKEGLKTRFLVQVKRESMGSAPPLATICWRDKEGILCHKPGSKAAFFSWESCYFLQDINVHVKYLVASNSGGVVLLPSSFRLRRSRRDWNIANRPIGLPFPDMNVRSRRLNTYVLAAKLKDLTGA